MSVLDGSVLTYDPRLGDGSIMLGYEDFRMCGKGFMVKDSPEIHIRVWINALLFRPVRGRVLLGYVVEVDQFFLRVRVCGKFSGTIRNEPDHFNFDADTKTWVGAGSSSGATIAVGDNVPFIVESCKPDSAGGVHINGKLSDGAGLRSIMEETNAGSSTSSKSKGSTR